MFKNKPRKHKYSFPLYQNPNDQNQSLSKNNPSSIDTELDQNLIDSEEESSLFTNNASSIKRKKHYSSKLAVYMMALVVVVSTAIALPFILNKPPAIDDTASSASAPPITTKEPGTLEENSPAENVSTPIPSTSVGDASEEPESNKSGTEEVSEHCADEGTADAAASVDPADTVDVVSSATVADDQKETRLVLGDHSESVAKLQKRLNELHYFEKSEYSNYYGPLTENSVKLFQQQNGLKADGVAGLKTLTLLYSKDAKPYKE